MKRNIESMKIVAANIKIRQFKESVFRFNTFKLRHVFWLKSCLFILWLCCFCGSCFKLCSINCDGNQVTKREHDVASFSDIYYHILKWYFGLSDTSGRSLNCPFTQTLTPVYAVFMQYYRTIIWLPWGVVWVPCVMQHSVVFWQGDFGRRVRDAGAVFHDGRWSLWTSSRSVRLHWLEHRSQLFWKMKWHPLPK